ncbi:L,D-transpeptidase Cds6 family protein, partial [Helicobacter pylori]
RTEIKDFQKDSKAYLDALGNDRIAFVSKKDTKHSALITEFGNRGDFERYMRFYNPNFTRYDGMKFNAFKEYKKRVFAKNEKKNI